MMITKEISRLSSKLQEALIKIGVAWHNPFRDECTKDFGCCVAKIGAYKERFPDKDLPIDLVLHTLNVGDTVLFKSKYPEAKWKVGVVEEIIPISQDCDWYFKVLENIPYGSTYSRNDYVYTLDEISELRKID